MTSNRALVWVPLLLLLAGAGKVHASECIGFSTATMLASREAIFIGEVTSIVPVGRHPAYGEILGVTFAVKETFVSRTATFSGKRIRLHQWASTGLTDFDNRFQSGREYLVFAFGSSTTPPRPLQAPAGDYTARSCDAWETNGDLGKRMLAELRTLRRSGVVKGGR